MHIVGADQSGGRGRVLETEAREGGLIEEIRLETSVRNPQRSASMLDLVLYEKCRAEPNLVLLLNTTVTGVEMKDGAIALARAERPSTEDVFRISAAVFVDCTGDGRLGVEAGAPFQHGREDKAAYGESLAQDVADRRTLGSTLLFQARHHDRPMPFVAPPWARTFTEADLRLRPHARSGIDRGLEYGYWWAEWGGELDTIKDNETIRDELLAILLGVWNHIKNGPPGTPPGADPHGAANWALDWFGFLPGKRESRRFIGQHVLTENDLVPSRAFPDAIAHGGWALDRHPPQGIDAADIPPAAFRQLDHLYDIPLRSCVSKSVPNLMFAGRNISASHIAFASTRVMATCAAIGQGVGTAAALGLARGLRPDAIADDADALTALRQRLLKDDVYLIGVRNEDPGDLARSASVVRASSEQPAGAAANILTGQTRAVHGVRGVSPDRARPGTHRWMSQPEAGFPAWVELEWSSPVRMAEIRLVFDTGQHRPLALTHSDGFADRMEWGRAQSETVKDYDVAVRGPDGGWTTVVECRGNYQRLVVHRLAAGVDATAVRVTVLATNGLDHARIMEIRVYA
jgi:hypothetical protein